VAEKAKARKVEVQSAAPVEVTAGS
jgi:hypothetical protein